MYRRPKPKPTKQKNKEGDPLCITYVCRICDKQLACRSSLFNHNKLVHNIQPTKRSSIACKELGCGFTCNLQQKLRDHLASVHCKPMQCKKETFASMQVFEAWLSKLQQRHQSQYIKKYSWRVDSFNRKYQYLTCSHSGYVKDKSKGNKRKRATRKIGGHCTSFVTYYESDDGTVDVKYCLTHHGHATDSTPDSLRDTRSALEERLESLRQEVERHGDADVTAETVRRLGKLEAELVLRRTNREELQRRSEVETGGGGTVEVNGRIFAPAAERKIRGRNVSTNKFRTILPKEVFCIKTSN